MPARFYRVIGPVLICLFATTTLPAQTTDREFREALQEGSKLVREKRYAESRAPLEKAIQLAPDNEQRIRIYQALFNAYRLLPTIEEMSNACEFIMTHTQQPSQRQLTARRLTSYLHERGKTPEAVQRYEARLKETPDDKAALALLISIHSHTDRQPARVAELTPKLIAAEQEMAREHAVDLEREINDTPAPQLAWQWKEVALAWLAADAKPQALSAAHKSLDCPPEERSQILTFYWRHGLGDVFLGADEPKFAIENYELALENTTIKGYRDTVEKKLAEAREQLKR